MTWTWKDASPTTFATNDDNNNDNNNTADDDDDDEWTSGDLIVIVTVRILLTHPINTPLQYHVITYTISYNPILLSHNPRSVATPS